MGKKLGNESRFVSFAVLVSMSRYDLIISWGKYGRLWWMTLVENYIGVNST